MAKWMKPSEELPEVNVGDRIVCIVIERDNARSPLRPRVVILEATEDGWTSPDEVYAGYSVEDCALWSTEESVCDIAHAVCCYDP